MAVNLTVALTDAEQARLSDVAALVAPNATPAQVKEWAETTAKAKLRDEVLRIHRDAVRDAENAARRQDEQAWSNDWPDPDDAANE